MGGSPEIYVGSDEEEFMNDNYILQIDPEATPTINADTLSNKPLEYFVSKDDLNNISMVLESVETDAKFFDIDCDGLISLKPEYRGKSTAEFIRNYPFSESDMGANKEGSKIFELPEYIIIPQNVDGEQVTGFQKGIFCCNYRIKGVVISPIIKNIANGAFLQAIHLEKVENTEQIETIGNTGFSRTRITELRCPNLLTLGVRAFCNCSCLRLVDVGKITTINKFTFEYCENLSEVIGGANITSIGESAFYGTRRLKNLSFLANVTSVGKSAFFS
jgi:hypothetical protein